MLSGRTDFSHRFADFDAIICESVAKISATKLYDTGLIYGLIIRKLCFINDFADDLVEFLGTHS